MISLSPHSRRGSAVIALMVLAVIVIGSMLSVTTAAIITVGNTSRALEIARQNAATATRLEHATREATLAVYGTALSPSSKGLDAELRALVASVELGAVQIDTIQVSPLPAPPRSFPNFAGPPDPLLPLSDSLALLSTPSLLAHLASRGRDAVAESGTFWVRFGYKRPVLSGNQTYQVQVNCRLAAVPLTRHGLVPYELPSDIGSFATGARWPSSIEAAEIAPMGLVPGRDPAAVNVLARKATGPRTNRPGYFRALGAMSDAYQYVFSDAYLQRVADYVGSTHFVLIGAGAANPVLEGGNETAETYHLDLALFGRGTWGSTSATHPAALLYANAAGRRVVLSDSGTQTTPILLIVAGPGGAAPLAPLEVEIATDILRPIVLIGYNVALHAPGARRVNGALLLDPHCTVSGAAGPFTVGHLSYAAAGGRVEVDRFALQTMPVDAEVLAPRVIYAASSKTLL